MGNKNTSQRVEAALIERENKALDLYINGMKFADIAKEVGWRDRQSASAAIKRAITRRRAERDDLADQAATIMLEQLDTLYRAHIEIATGTTDDRYKATDRVLQVMDRIAKLKNLYAPVQVETTVRVKDELDDEIATLVRKLKDAGPADALPDTPVLDSIIDAQVVDDDADEGAEA